MTVEAVLDASQAESQARQLEQQLNAIGQQIAQANKTQFNPISGNTLNDLKKMQAQFEALRKISGELNRRLNATGQKDTAFVDIDWAKLYPNQTTRHRKMAEAFGYVTGGGFSPPPPAPAPPAPPAPPPPSNGGGQPPTPVPPPPSGGGLAVGAAQSGLNAINPLTGGLGAVGANAVGVGASGGFGAGFGALLGGVLALGVGKLVGAVSDKVTQAEDNAVAYDKLKRIIGDVGVSFGGLKASLSEAANSTKLTYAETAKLGTQFVQLGNITSKQMDSIPDELKLGVGFGRAFGLDPSQSTGVMGQMRGIGQTKNLQETRKFALLIGETIGKSKAFAKAGEVMEAVGNYAITQGRNNLGVANVEGYAGAFAGLAGSKTAGLDPAGVANLLSKVNASIMAGGAKGEASQFFTAGLGQKMGLTPFQTQMLREGGAFATKSNTFGKGTIYSEFMGKDGPKGTETMLSATLGELKAQYGKNKEDLIWATSNHLGVNSVQAMALHKLTPEKMGGMSKYANLLGMTGSGIGNLSTALHGTDEQRLDLVANLKARKGSDRLSSSEETELNNAMSSGNQGKLKDVLARLVAVRDQESTQGSDIRDSKNLLDNIKVLMADRLVPLFQDIRAATLSIAGVGDGKTSEGIFESIVKADSDARIKRITSESDKKLVDLEEKWRRGKSETQYKPDPYNYRNRPELLAGATEKYNATLKNLPELEKQIAAEKNRRVEAIKEEEARRAEEMAAVNTTAKKQREAEAVQQKEEKERQKIIDANEQSAVDKAKIKGSLKWDKYVPDNLFKRMLSAESGGNHRDKNGKLITSPMGALGIGQLMPSTSKNPGFGILGIQNDSEGENIRVSKSYLGALIAKYHGDEKKGVAAYNTGPANLDKIIKKYKGDWMSHLPDETRDYIPKIFGDKKLEGSPAPKVKSNRGANTQRFSIDPLEVIHLNERREQQGQSEYLNTRVSQAAPFGADRSFA
ncbi:lytic transglycosylase domain-containing protein [Polynucleobacter sp.]|uniref:lytic transglycosylase domain-containing protein n=1 Tax=Polynucleobacter sp. TaxID=2029855 RepID=UPI003F69E574